MSERTDLKIFVASSGELQAERDESLKVIVELNKSFRYLNLEPILFELSTAAGNNAEVGRIQDAINPLLDECEIVVVLFYSRVGEFTLEEFNRAKEAGKKIFLYLKEGFVPTNVDTANKYIEVLRLKETIENESKIRYQKFDSVKTYNGLLYKDLNKYLSDNTLFFDKQGETKTLVRLKHIENELSVYPNSNVLVFYSYSHRDESYKESLDTHLSILKRQRYLEGWNDRKIAPGENWEEEINLNLQQSDIVLLLVSSNFLASDYCYDTETIYALEQHEKGNCIVIPVILKPCLWSVSEFKHLQVLPKNGKPISTWKNKDEAWLDVSEGILKVIKKIKEKEKENEKKAHSKNNPSISLKAPTQQSKDIEKEERGFNFGNPSPPIIDTSCAELLLKFLQQFNNFYFSPLRIQKWGSNQKGFSLLDFYSTETIKNELEKLLISQKVKMKLSQKKNRIYKIN